MSSENVDNDAGQEINGGIWDKYADERTSKWFQMLQMSGGKTPQPLSNTVNCLTLLRFNPEFACVFRFNEFSQNIEITTRPPWQDKYEDFTPRTMRDVDYVRLQSFIQAQGIRGASMNCVVDAVLAAAHDSTHHPIRTYLYDLTWDGVPRAETWLIDFLGAQDTALNRAIGFKFLVGAVARVANPGCKLDTLMILEGVQGLGKSQALGVLGGEWFSDHMPADITSKDAGLALQGAWLIEQSEMHSVRHAEADSLKAFLSRRIDRFRPPYGRVVASFPRQCVLAGTMNPSSHGYLTDETGGRRFWPVLCGVGWEPGRKVDLALRDVRDQLWAEAKAMVEVGETWWLDSDSLEEDQEKATDQRFDSDVWTAVVLKFLDGQIDVTLDDVLAGALRLEPRDWNKSAQTRVGSILRKAGWLHRRGRESGVRARRYYNPNPPAATTTTTATGATGASDKQQPQQGRDLVALFNLGTVPPSKAG
jgi:putative DNA primase/helicase